MIDALVRLMGTPHEVTGPMNLGNPDEFSIRELADFVLEFTGSRSEIKFEPLPSDDPRQRCPDIELARKTLDWQPHTPLREGLKKTIEYFEGMLRGYKLPEGTLGRQPD